jgi:putative ABC transport system permease protein
MTFFTPVLANLRRRPSRSVLTALGTALGVATIVALLAVADGAKRTAGQLVHLGRADFGLFQKDAADLSTSIVSTTLEDRLRTRPYIADTSPLQLLIESVRRDPAAVVFGGRQDDFVTRRLVFSAGRLYRRPGEIAVGDHLANELNLRVGDKLVVHNRPFRITGIYHAGVLFQDRGAYISLTDAQRLTGHPGEATTIAVQLAPGAHASEARKRIERDFPGIRVITDAEQAPRAGANSALINKAAVVIALLALVLGGIGVANTMLLSVLERKPEMAILSAVGWSGPQVAGLVLAEGVAVGLIGAGLGLIAGAFGSRALVHLLGASGFVEPLVTDWSIARGLLVGAGIGIVGGVYPAWRAARLAPAPALAQR